MKLKQLKPPRAPDDPDFPLIWDIVQAKLKAGADIVMPMVLTRYGSEPREYEDVHVIGLHHDEKDTTLPYAIIWKRGTPSRNLLWFDEEMILGWRLRKEGDHWRLTTGDW
jgi:hypothetical protein